MVDLDARPTPTAFSERVGLLTVRLMEATNICLFRLSDGRVGGSIFGAPVILLTTSGRRSGERYTKPLLALADGDSWIVVASRGGTTDHPDWFENLAAFARRTPDQRPVHAPPTVELPGGRSIPVVAEVLTGDERASWWARLADVYPKFDSYQDRARRREIPVVRLSPATH